MQYEAFVVREIGVGVFESSIETLDTKDLPAGDVLIKVSHSSINYKDALSFSGNKGVTRHFPHTPGIDAVGEVVSCSNGNFTVGQAVMVIGYDLGMNTPGGFGEYIQVPSGWVLTRPSELSPIDAMAWGTAGLTAALCIEKLIKLGLPLNSGPVLVSGGTGGVGSIAIRLLTKMGYDVHALTSKQHAAEYLRALGATDVMLLEEFKTNNQRPLSKPVYAGGIDVAGGETLATMLKVMNYQASIACCGLVDDVSLNVTVLPFILRGINLLGVDSVELPLDVKQEIWGKIANQWSLPSLSDEFTLIKKTQLKDALNSLIDKTNKGRFILQHD